MSQETINIEIAGRSYPLTVSIEEVDGIINAAEEIDKMIAKLKSQFAVQLNQIQEELFYQIEGDIILKTQQDGKMVEIPINEGEMFLLPAKIPHSPVRAKNSIGLVIEKKRESHHQDGLLWYSETENILLYEEYFHLTNIEKDFLPVFKKFYSNKDLRTCPVSGEIMDIDDRFV